MKEVEEQISGLVSKKTCLQGFIFLLIADVLVFGPSLQFGFLDYSDDRAYIFNNPYLKNLSLSNLLAIFADVDFDTYLPLTLVSFSVDYTVWKMNPMGYHLTQLILHLANSLFVLILLLKLNINRTVALAAALLYSVHPVHVESVVWISERKNLLSAFFIFPSILFYMNYVERPADGRRYLLASLAFFVFGLLSKSIALVVPFIFILLDLFIYKRGLRIYEKIPFFAGALLMGLMTLRNQGQMGFIRTIYPGDSFWMSLVFTVRIYGDYLLSMLFPVQLSPYYIFAVQKKLLVWKSLVSYGVIPLLLYYGIKNWRVRPLHAFAVGWFVVFLLPVSNIIPINTMRNDRFLYLPSVMFFPVCLAAVMNNPWMRSAGKKCTIYAGILFVMFGVLTLRHLPTYGDSKTYWEHVANLYPNWSDAQYEAGVQCRKIRNADCAISYYQKAIRADEQNAPAWNNLGAVLIDLENYSEAFPYVKKASEIDPGYADAYYNLALLADKLGRDRDMIPVWLQKYEEISGVAAKK